MLLANLLRDVNNGGQGRPCPYQNHVVVGTRPALSGFANSIVNRVDPSGMQACPPGMACLPTPTYTPISPCVFDVNAPGCAVQAQPIFPISTVNQGDFSTETLINRCSMLNGGLCTDDVDSLLQSLIPNTPTKPLHPNSQTIGRDRNGNCNSCPPPTVDCRIDMLAPSGFGSSRGGHGCPPQTKAHFHIDTTQWSGPWVDPASNDCHCIWYVMPYVECIQDLKDIPQWYIFCSSGYRLNFGPL
jgi:hypothetical protein